MCELMGALPQEGGVLDQDHILLRGLQMVYEAKQERKNKDSNSKKGK